MGRAGLKALAARFGIHPSRSLGQHFLADPNLARAIVADADVGAGDRVLEVGAGMGSLTVALADAGCRVLAIELDRGLLPALREVVAGRPDVETRLGDAMRADWPAMLGRDRWAMVSNLPYNVSVPLVLDLLEAAPSIERYVVMVQREVGERLVAKPGEDPYGAVSVRIAYRARARMVRRVPADVFWPRPKVDSVLVRIEPHAPPVDVDPIPLFRVVHGGFAERRKTMTNALRRMGVDADVAGSIVREAGLEEKVRAERLGLDEFARITELLLATGWAA
ncbi:MAG TPA: 16S rRNA (adenine(1518)-N(6)/adenine(1519)-N(6))-dimethyltransferase RsmA [Actinomycetota bacterium]